jgi:hypothetical protein
MELAIKDVNGILLFTRMRTITLWIIKSSLGQRGIEENKVY